MTFNLVNKGPRNIPHAAALIWRPAILGYSVSTTETKSWAHKFKDDREVETIGTLWLIVQDMDWYQEGTEKFIPDYDNINALVLEGCTLRMSCIARDTVQLDVNCFFGRGGG